MVSGTPGEPGLATAWSSSLACTVAFVRRNGVLIATFQFECFVFGANLPGWLRFPALLLAAPLCRLVAFKQDFVFPVLALEEPTPPQRDARRAGIAKQAHKPLASRRS